MTNNTGAPLPFDIEAFVLALICAPVLVTLILGILIVPLGALFLGAPLYLLIGTPTLLWMVGRYPPNFTRFALAGLGSILILVALVGVLYLFQPSNSLWTSISYLALGAVFAPLWAGTFAPLYRAWNRQNRIMSPF